MAWFEIISEKYPATGVDVQPVEADGECSIMHVCFPFNSEAFVRECARYIRKYRPYYLLEANYFAENVLGMNHEIKAGVDYEVAKEDLEWLSPNERSVRDYFRSDRSLARVLMVTVPNVRYFKTPRTGLFFQDTISYKRLTATIGAPLRCPMPRSRVVVS